MNKANNPEQEHISFEITKENKFISNIELDNSDKQYWGNSLNSLNKSLEETDKRIALARSIGFKTAAEILDFIFENNLLYINADNEEIEEREFAEDKLHDFLYKNYKK